MPALGRKRHGRCAMTFLACSLASETMSWMADFGNKLLPKCRRLPELQWMFSTKFGQLARWYLAVSSYVCEAPQPVRQLMLKLDKDGVGLEVAGRPCDSICR